VEPGPFRIAVRGGARRVVQAVEGKAGREVRVEVILPRPKPPTGSPQPVSLEVMEEFVEVEHDR
jgi:hypothetical protein